MGDSAERGRVPRAIGLMFGRMLARWATPGAGRVAICSPAVGMIAGLGAVAFLRLLELMFEHVLKGMMHLQIPPTGEGTAHPISDPWPWWAVLLLPTLGGLISGLLVFTWAPEAEGHGTDALIRAFHRGGGKIRGRVPLIKGIASVITIGTGGSAGQEGPIAQIGAGFGSFLGRLLRLSPNEARLLTLAGAAGGVGAIFRAPLGGALFAVEVIYATTAIESAALMPCLTASIIAYTTFALFITPAPIFIVPALSFRGFGELPMFAGLAVACAGMGWVYVRVFYGMRDYVFKPIPLPRHVKPAIGGFLVGLVALVFPQVMTGGYGWVQWGAIGMPPSLALPGESIFTPHMGVGLLLTLALLKTVTTGLTISSGGSGGVFGPSMFIGGMLGGAVGQLYNDFLPGPDLHPAAFALVGMGGFFAGVSKTPLTSIVMVCEMAGNYSLLVPLMLVCGLNMGLSRRWTIYEEQVASPVDSPAHRGDFVVDVLERLRVDQLPIRVEGLERVDASTPCAEIVRRAARSAESLFLVVDRDGRLTGVFSLADIRLALAGSDWAPLVLADDLAHRPVVSVTPEDDLHTALKRLTDLNLEEIPVVARDDRGQLLGLLSRKSLVAAYSDQVDALRSPPPATSP
ncbi:chloride channel protein [Tundrisphaera sp. TA3]|uniref:chloride channel protein n=1 Tax=Tundrisphaera sp. TA3 TaxID=3435775 RepID=UPI003EBD4D84